MILPVKLYPAWFDDELSKKACKRLGVDVCYASEWFDASLLDTLLLPADFNLITYADKGKIHVLHFTPPDPRYEKFLIHPGKLIEISRRATKRLLTTGDTSRLLLS